MQIAFDVAGTPAEFRRNDVTGRTELRLGEEIVELQSPYRLSAHFAAGTEQVWTCRANDHDIQIVKVRPRVVGGLRDNSFTISVDDQVVAEAVGK
jgi:hypothetical protein